VSERRGEGLRKRDTKSSKLEERREREGVEGKIEGSGSPGVGLRIGQPRRLPE